MARLTAISVRSIRPRAERFEVPDSGCRGLYLVVQPSGHRSFAVRYRSGGKPAKLTLPAGLSLAAARQEAASVLHELERGADPAAMRAAARAKAAAAAADTVRSVCTEYLKREGGKLRSAGARERTLERLVYPALGNVPIAAVKRSDIVRLLDRVEDNSGPRMADLTLAILRRVMNWFASRSDEFRSPIVPGMARTNAHERRRSRILSDDELRSVWGAAGQAGVFESLIKFLLLSTARRNEAAAMQWSEVKDGVWCLPAARNKTKVELCRPLSPSALAVLNGLPRFDGCPYVFTNDGHRRIGGFSNFKRKFDAACGVCGWHLHDLRRTSRSLLSRAGVNVDIAERCLGHVIPGVRGTYDLRQYQAEMLHAFEALAAWIDQIVNPPGGVNVVALRA